MSLKEEEKKALLKLESFRDSKAWHSWARENVDSSRSEEEGDAIELFPLVQRHNLQKTCSLLHRRIKSRIFNKWKPKGAWI